MAPAKRLWACRRSAASALGRPASESCQVPPWHASPSPGAALDTVDVGYALIPVGFVDGLPAGVQILSRRFREDLILDAMAVVESEVGVLARTLWAREG